jgi:hypothetical protein
MLSYFLPSRLCYVNIHCSKILSIEDNVTTYCNVRQWFSNDTNIYKWFCTNHEPKNSKDESTILLNEILNMKPPPPAYATQTDIINNDNKNLSNEITNPIINTINDNTKQPPLPSTSNSTTVDDDRKQPSIPSVSSPTSNPDPASVDQILPSSIKLPSPLCVDGNSMKEMSESGGVGIARGITVVNIGKTVFLIIGSHISILKTGVI